MTFGAGLDENLAWADEFAGTVKKRIDEHLGVEPDPPAVLETIYALLYADLASGRRGLADTVIVLRQMRSMLRLPATMYADLNAVLVAHSAAGSKADTIAAWLQQFAKAEVASRSLNPRV